MAMLRVGHGGAGALVRGNTIASFDAALEAGVDMIEFDVRAKDGVLVLAHSPFDLHFRCGPTLSAALRHLSGARFRDLRFDLDVKQPGIEAATLYALEAAGITDRCLISCGSAAVLDRFRALDPSVRTGLSVRRRRDRHSALKALEARRFDAVMAHHRIVDPLFSSRVQQRAGELFAWTVDERAGVERMRAAGVSGCITNDPRLFAPVAATG